MSKPAPSTQGDLTLKVAYVALAATQSPLWMGQATGAFEQQHLKVDMQYIDSTVSVNALIAKEIDVIIQSASSVITADLNGGADLVYVGSGSNHSQGEMLSLPSIKTAADLKGKLVGTDRPGTTTDYYTQVTLKLLGLQPSDVQLRPIGSTNIVFQALQSGQIQAGCMTPPQSLQSEASGFTALQNTYAVPYQGSGPVISHRRIQELAPALIRFLVGYRAGMQAFVDQPDLAKKTIGQYAKITDQAVLDQTYNFHRTSNPFQMDLKPTMEGIQQMIDFLAPSMPAAKNAKAEQFVDLSLLPQVPPLKS